MSPSAQVHDDQATRRSGMHGPRPSSLKVNKDSHHIHKASSSHQQQRQPVIIYTHSPKVIHTHARDFMALVQKLTGLSSPEDDSSSTPSKDHAGQASDSHKDVNTMEIDSNHGTPSPDFYMNENFSVEEAKMSSSSAFPVFDPLDPIPLFTPNSSFCSPYPLYRYPDPVFFSPSHVGSSISSSTIEAFGSFPEY